MKILISNDDGVHSLGIEFLNNELKKNNDTLVIAPDKERSSCGHGITLHEALRVNKIEKNIYSCSGTPADCILIGVGVDKFFKVNKADLVVSGINHGANIGQDRYYSGTIAAAREAAFRGIPSIAVSLVTIGIRDVEHFEVAAKFVAMLIERGIKKLIPPLCVLNINVPNLEQEKISGVKLTLCGMQLYSEEVIERIDGRGKNYYWVGGTYSGSKDVAGSDGNAVKDGFISVNLQDLSGKNNHNLDELEDFIKSLE